MSKKHKIKPAVAVNNRTADPYITLGAGRVENDAFWRWGDDNLFPNALALMARRSVTHRRIINDKADYISGKGFTCDEAQQPRLAAFLRHVNGDGESLRQVLNKLAFDKALFGNAFLEVGDRRRAYVPLAAPSGRLALPAGPRLGPRPAPPRLDGVQSRRSADPAPLPGIRRAVRRHAARRDPLQGLRTDVRTLRRAALHRGVQRLGHRLQDRQVEYLAARQLVPALRRDDARQYGGQRGRSRTHRTAGRAEIRGQPRTGDVRHPRQRRAERQFAFYSDRVAERGRLAGAARAGRVGHRRGPLVVPDS